MTATQTDAWDAVIKLLDEQTSFDTLLTIQDAFKVAGCQEVADAFDILLDQIRNGALPEA